MNSYMNCYTKSDNESAPSPVKLRSKVPYCKTYEQMRLEEIQAESAAYYSYEVGYDAGVHRSPGDVGKAKSISTSRGGKWICMNPPKDKKEEPPKGLDFKVLSLEEIRRQKKEKEVVAKIPIDTLEPSSPAEERGVKRCSVEEPGKESVSPVKKRKISSDFEKNKEPAVKVPPVKLRRSLKSIITKETKTQPCNDMAVNERRVADQVDETSCYERLENHNMIGPANMIRRGEVEIRLCDSSTNEKRTQTQLERAMEERKSVSTYTTEDVMSCVLLDDSQPYVSAEEEYLRLDTSSDDIMRDIEDLLK